MGEENSLITRVILKYHPLWDPPKDRREWNQCLCPWHGDNRPSASVSYENDAFKCFSCDASGDVIKIIIREEGVAYGEAVRIATDLSEGKYQPVPRKPQRIARRKIFGEPRTDGLGQDEGGDGEVSPRVRRRTFGGT